MTRYGLFGLALALSVFTNVGMASRASAEPLKVGYSDWPGWVAWQVAIDKGWLKEAGVDVEFQWFDYGPSMDAFSANQIDAVTVTNGDALVMGGGGAKGVMIMVTDYSNGNDMIVAKPGIDTLKDLRGKKVGLERGLVEHLLLLSGLKKEGMSEDDVEIVNVATNETPRVLASGDVDAIGAWQPNSGQAMTLVAGAHPVFTSAEDPGLIYDTITVSPQSLATHRDEWIKLVKVWNKVVDYINNPQTQPDALKIMSGRVGLTPDQYKPLLAGTKLLTLQEGQKVFQKGDGLTSIYGSSATVDKFNVDNKIYAAPQDIGSYIDPTITNEALK